MSIFERQPSIESTLRDRAALIACLEWAARAVQKAQQIAQRAHLTQPKVSVEFEPGCSCALSVDDLHRTIERTIDASGWRYLINEGSLRQFLDPMMRARWMRRLNEGEVLTLTRENVAQTVQAACDARHERLERRRARPTRSMSRRIV